MIDGADVGPRLSRRQLVGGAAATVASAVLSDPIAAGARRRRRRRPRAAVLGGGIGGLTVAQELIERGVDVTVYERRALGGKARSYGVAGTATGGRLPLPGEHGFRFFPGFYHNLPDTMRRIPRAGGGGNTFEHLRGVPQLMFARAGMRSDTYLPMNLALDRWQPEDAVDTITSLLDTGSRIPPQELAYFAKRLLVYMASCDARRYGQWENTSWMDFVGAGSFSQEYDKFVANNITRQILAAKADACSARTLGGMFEALVYVFAAPQGTREYARVLNGPTNRVWIDPWVEHLRTLGVRFELGQSVQALELSGDRIRSARIRGDRGREESVQADWFFCCLPMERARKLFGRRLRAADPQLEAMDGLTADWLTGFQFYLDRPTSIAPALIAYLDSPWGLASLSQRQFWDAIGRFEDEYGDGRAKDCLSVDIGSWDAPGIVYDKPARELRPPAIARELLAQIEQHLNDFGEAKLGPGRVLGWSLDQGIRRTRAGRIVGNDDPLFINRRSSWQLRPTAVTAVSNLFLAADYVQMSADVACMEGANEAARRAVNAFLDEAHSPAARCEVYELYRPPEWEAWKALDRERYRQGRPNVLDLPTLPEDLEAMVGDRGGARIDVEAWARR